MASKRSTPGTYTQNGVRCTLGAPFDKAAASRTGSGGGVDGRNRAPFDKPQDVGNGGIPTRFYDGMSPNVASTKSAGVNAGMGGLAGINRTNPVGTRRFKNPK